MKHKKRLSDLEKWVGAKELKIILFKFSSNVKRREEAVAGIDADIIVWYFSDTPPKKWSET